jgi:hypothetical protein
VPVDSCVVPVDPGVVPVDLDVVLGDFLCSVLSGVRVLYIIVCPFLLVAVGHGIV